ncbi:MAG: alanine--tRNA ligase [Clostridia bacterium]|nr:alanine--tRNA ligase [Clostridia bacterium]
MKIQSQKLRDTWLKYYEEKGHLNIGAVSLIGDGSTGVMFNVAGMQPLMPYLLGAKHPSGKTRLCNVQGCVRTIDIESVGDQTHLTFFEMMGNWSLGDYFKKEKTKWTYDLLTKVFGLDGNKICATVFAGDNSAPRDEETAGLLKDLGIKPENIYYLPKEDNWWELEGTVGTPCGPDNEWFYPLHDKPCGPHCDINCKCGRYVEVGNDVYMQYKKLENGYEPLSNKNVDTGFGFERVLMFLNGLTDVYKTDLFEEVVAYAENKAGKKYGTDEETTKAIRIVADHMRTTVMLIGDPNGIVPSNTGSGYVLRRLMRRAIRFARSINLSAEDLCEIAKIYIEKVYNHAYPLLVEKEDYILAELTKEINKFEAMLVQGTKEFEKVVSGIARKNEFMSKSNPNYKPETQISGKSAFRLYETYGFPVEMTIEMAAEKGLSVDMDGYKQAFEEHQELARTARAGENKGGLAGQGELETQYHTATHLTLAGLRKLFGTQTVQHGSNITSERMRFDFNLDRKMTDEEIKWLEDFVNDAIARKIDVVRKEMPYSKALESGAYGIYNGKPDEVVSVYVIGDVDNQICGGPHVKNTSELGHYKIVKEQSSSSGIRRIKAVLTH